MYKILTVEDKVRVPPVKFRLAQDEAIKVSLEDAFEGIIDRKVGVILAVTEIISIGEGRIFPGDGSINYPVQFKVLIYLPELHELVKGPVIDVTEFGVFVRIGALDGMVHVSQIMNDFVSYDQKNAIFTGRESSRVLKEGDTAKARIVAVSLGKEYKIGLTMRQPGLGVEGWPQKEKESQEKHVRRKGGKGQQAPKKLSD
ncbi:MAG: DNA-directed RNA polymerase [Nanoarchaeota archaeon]|nr:DNA-directed RNA polymerase [Nanoarchaeota archaeon]